MKTCADVVYVFYNDRYCTSGEGKTVEPYMSEVSDSNNTLEISNIDFHFSCLRKCHLKSTQHCVEKLKQKQLRLATKSGLSYVMLFQRVLKFAGN